jgi:hypothetical protein
MKFIGKIYERSDQNSVWDTVTFERIFKDGKTMKACLGGHAFRILELKQQISEAVGDEKWKEIEPLVDEAVSESWSEGQLDAINDTD